MLLRKKLGMSEYWSAICDWDRTGVYSAVGVWIVLFFEREEIYMIYGLKDYLLKHAEQTSIFTAVPLNFYTPNREKSLGSEGGDLSSPLDPLPRVQVDDDGNAHLRGLVPCPDNNLRSYLNSNPRLD